ncbi:MAG TPA: activase, partial [Candidatus Eisenbacteria bacterium]
MHRLGVDVGALFIKAVRLDEDGAILARAYERHRGRPREALEQVFERLGAGPGDTIGVTGSGGAALAEALGAPYRDVT